MGNLTTQDFLGKEGGLVPVAVGTLLALGLLGMLYFFGGFGSPDIKAFRDQCHQRKLREAAHLASRPDYDQVVLQCEGELRDFLARR